MKLKQFNNAKKIALVRLQTSVRHDLLPADAIPVLDQVIRAVALQLVTDVASNEEKSLM